MPTSSPEDVVCISRAFIRAQENAENGCRHIRRSRILRPMLPGQRPATGKLYRSSTTWVGQMGPRSDTGGCVGRKWPSQASDSDGTRGYRYAGAGCFGRPGCAWPGRLRATQNLAPACHMVSVAPMLVPVGASSGRPPSRHPRARRATGFDQQRQPTACDALRKPPQQSWSPVGFRIRHFHSRRNDYRHKRRPHQHAGLRAIHHGFCRSLPSWWVCMAPCFGMWRFHPRFPEMTWLVATC